MAKKVGLLMAAVAILAFAIPSMASAAGITSKAGTLAPVGTKITGTNLTTTTLTSSLLGPITCETLNLKGTITQNDGTTVNGKSESKEEFTAGECLRNKVAITVTSVNVEELFATGTSGTGKAKFTAVIDIPGVGTCTFTGVNVPFSYAIGGDTIVFNKAAGVSATPAACGTSTLDAEYTIEIGSTPVILD